MSVSTTASASDLARQTPATRDRYVDFLRLFSIAVVVLGHWLMAVVSWHGSEFHTDNVIGMVPGLWLATWLLQIMPIFFFVGGFANLATIDAMRKRGEGASEFVASRVARLLRPVAVLLGVWVVAAVALERLGLDARVLRAATKLVCQPLWFIGVYLAVTALAPVMRDLHARHATRTAATIAAIAIAVDVFRFGAGVDALGYLNVLIVWLFAQQLGFFYADGSLARISRTRLAAVAVSALGVLTMLTTFGPYPHSMVGLPGDRISNMSPPTICLLVLTVFEVAIVMLLRPYAQRWLARPRVWTAVVAGNGVIMTIFLWHLTAALVALDVLYHVGFPQPAGGSALWWVTRPAWIAAAAVPLLALVALFGRIERPRPARYLATSPASPALASTGIALLSFAVFGIACTNLADIIAGAPVDVAVVARDPGPAPGRRARRPRVRGRERPAPAPDCGAASVISAGDPPPRPQPGGPGEWLSGRPQRPPNKFVMATCDHCGHVDNSGAAACPRCGNPAVADLVAVAPNPASLLAPSGTPSWPPRTTQPESPTGWGRPRPPEPATAADAATMTTATDTIAPPVVVVRSARSLEWKMGAALAAIVVIGLVVAIVAVTSQTPLNHTTNLQASAQNTARDRAAQSDLRNALTAEKTTFTDNQAYDPSSANMRAIEPSLDWGGKLQVVVGDAVAAGDRGVVCLSEPSLSGKTFSLGDVAAGPSAGTYYGTSACPSSVTGASVAAIGSSWPTVGATSSSGFGSSFGSSGVTPSLGGSGVSSFGNGDAAAQSDLRNALTAELTYYTDTQRFTADSAALRQIEPSLDWGGKLQVVVGNSDVSSNDIVCVSETSSSGSTFELAHVSTGAFATYYGRVSAGCPQPATQASLADLGTTPW